MKNAKIKKIDELSRDIEDNGLSYLNKVINK
jgi:hypothetical protein